MMNPDRAVGKVGAREAGDVGLDPTDSQYQFQTQHRFVVCEVIEFAILSEDKPENIDDTVRNSVSPGFPADESSPNFAVEML